ncbi:MAG TPA: hypothetical protein VMB84_15950 [Stellaceae bacterium]|nr:hypothetical protein [Stellaceae bacterium]
MLRKTAVVAIALASAVVGAHSLNPRELYNEMYPVETLKRDAFHICDEADPTFVRAVRADRDACYQSMPHAIAVALGLKRPGGALSMAALLDPSHQAEFLMTLAGIPPRQPVTAPRSFANTAWVRALSPTCEERRPLPAVAYAAPSALPPPAGKGRAAALDSVILGNLPPMPRPAQARIGARQAAAAVPVLPLTAVAPPAVVPPEPAGDRSIVASFDPLPAPDIGDLSTPAIVPLAPTSSCGGA